MSERTSPSPVPGLLEGVSQQAALRPRGKSLTRHITLIVGGQLHKALVQDVSRERIRLLLEASLAPGDVVGIEMDRQSRMFFCSRLLRVASVVEAETGGYLAECEFSTPLSREQLLPLIW